MAAARLQLVKEIFRTAQSGSRPEGPRAGVRFLGRGSQPVGLGSAVSSPAAYGAEPEPKLNLVHYRLGIW